MPQYMDGLYYALLEGRFLFDFVHEEKLSSGDLKKYSALLLPNIALLSDEQCRQMRAYVAAGGSLLATFETSLYTERNERRADFGLADVFGIHKAGEIIGTNGNAYMARIEKPHPILEGFQGTQLIPGAEYRVPVAPVDDPVADRRSRLTWPIRRNSPTTPNRATTEPAVVVRAKRAKPPRLFSRRHRAHAVEIWSHRSHPATPEHDPLGCGRHARAVREGEE